MLLEYLVPSKVRREVWKALHSQGEPVTVRELARKAGVAYSNAHREVLRMRELGLLETRVAGRSLLCAWNRTNPATRTLSALLSGFGSAAAEPSADDALYSSLKHWGAGLARPVRSVRPFPLEETLASGVDLARWDPDVAQAWPVVLAKNRARVDLDRLELLGRRLGQKGALGLLLALTGTLLRDSALQKFAERLRDSRVRRTRDFFRLARGRRARRLAEANTPRLAKSWFFRLNTSLESFQRHFDKFVPRA